MLMRARKLLYVLGVCSPAFLLALLGISGHFILFPWQNPEYGPDANQHLLGYQRVVQATQEIDFATRKYSPDTILDIAQTWFDAEEQGELQPIPPADPYDLGASGVRGEIESAKRALLRAHYHAATGLIQEEQYEKAAEVLLTGIRLGEVNKHFSPMGTTASAQSQIAAIRRIKTLLPHLSPETVSETTRILETLDIKTESLQHTFHQIAVLRQVENKQHDFQAKFVPLFALEGRDLVVQAKTLSPEELGILNTFRQAVKYMGVLEEVVNEWHEKTNDEETNQEPVQNGQNKEVGFLVAKH